MAIFGPKPWVNPFGKSSIFRHFELVVFIAQEGVFSFQNIVKVIFLTNITLQKRVGKMAIFGPKPCVNPFGKMSIFRLFGTSCYFCLENRFFNLEYRKSHFPSLQCRKKKVGKIGIFGPKPWVNRFGKSSIFRHFELLVYIAQKGVFSFQIIEKVIFLTNIVEKKKCWKMAILGPKPWVNPFGKMSIF